MNHQNFSPRPALLLIDLQQGFNDETHWGGNRNNPDAEQICLKLLTYWRTHNLPIFHIRHHSTEADSPLNPKHAGFAFIPATAPMANECVIDKTVNSAFIGTDLQSRLHQAGIDTLVLAGLTTNHCVSTTARMAGNLGFTTFVVSDGTATFDRIGVNGERFDSQLVHDISLASLHGEFATVLKSDEILTMIGD